MKDRRQPTNDCCQKANNAKLQKFYRNQIPMMLNLSSAINNE